MADIEKTLRHEARYLSIAESCGDECGVEYGKMCLDAADEIERLRKALEQIARGTSIIFDKNPQEMSSREARDIARATLEDKRGGGE